MLRSEVNAAQQQAAAFLQDLRFRVPPWATWTPGDWAAQPGVRAYCHARQMGWDVTDFGSGDFARRGLLLLCTRNGRPGVPGDVPYAEKLLLVGEGQETPLHTHHHKSEDIIHRGGGVLVMELALVTPGGEVMDTPVPVTTDGRVRTLAPLEPLALHPGESITLHPGTYHRFYARPGGGPVLAGEVSAVNDDLRDNLFLEAVGRFPPVGEDAAPLYPLWSELVP